MEAKDTVMSVEESWGVYQANGGRGIPPREQVNSVAEAQTEITWDKAIREVMEWVREYKQNIAVAYKKPDMWICISNEELQAKLKEWGID